MGGARERLGHAEAPPGIAKATHFRIKDKKLNGAARI